MPGMVSSSESYRYGYVGGEKISELMGDGNYVDLGERGIDTRLGRLNWRIDPMANKFPYQSPYVYAGNNPILYIDKEGAFQFKYTDEQLEQQGLTKAEVVRFENIVNNIYKLVVDNPTALNAIANTTGFTEAQIMKDLKPNEGPTISIGWAGWIALIDGRKDGIVIDPKVIKHLAGISGNDKTLPQQTLGTALAILGAYGQYGDLVTNTEKDPKTGTEISYTTGEYHLGGDKYWNGSRTDFIFNSEDPQNYGDNNKDSGNQVWSRTLTGTRGTDIQKMGFGIAFIMNGKGEHEVDKSVEFHYWSFDGGTPPPTYGNPQVPPCTEYARGTKILEKLEVQ